MKTVSKVKRQINPQLKVDVFTLFDGAKIQVTTSKDIKSDGDQIAAGGICPNVEVENSDRFIITNHDDQLEHAINLCKMA